MNTSREEALKALAGCLSITIHRASGDEIVLYSPSKNAEVMKKAETAMKRGAAVTRNGGREWIHYEEIRKDGDYIWHADGNRVKCEVVRYKKNLKADNIVRTVDGEVWRNYV